MTTRIVGIFESEAAANEAADRLRDAGYPAELARAADRATAGRIDQRREMQDIGTAVVPPVTTGPMFRGMVVWTVVTAAVGFVLGALLAIPFDIGEWQEWQEWLLLGAIGAIALSSAGVIIGGARRPVTEGEVGDENIRIGDRTGDTTLGVEVPEAQAARAEHLMRSAGARDVAPADLRPGI